MNSFSPLYRFIQKHPRLILLTYLILAVVSLLYTWQNMTFLTGRDDLMPKNRPFYRNFAEYKKEFGEQADIVIVMEGKDSVTVSKFGTELYNSLKQDKTDFSDLFYPSGLGFLKKNGLLLMPTKDIDSLTTNIAMIAPLLKELSASPSVQTLFTYLTKETDSYISSGNEQQLTPLVFTLNKLGAGIKSFDKSGAADFSMEEFFLSGKDGEESALINAGRNQIMTATPKKDKTNFVPAEKAIKIVRGEIAKLKAKPEFKEITVGLTGTPVLENQEMTTSEHDITLATIISIVLTVILLLIVFRGVLNVVSAMTTILVAISLSFGFATLTVGHLNILSVVFAVMLMGIGIEYGIQIVLRYQEELSKGNDKATSIGIGLERNILAIIMAAATIAAAFFTFVLTDFKGIAELGIIAAGGIAICVVVTLTLLPAMLLLISPGKSKIRTTINNSETDKTFTGSVKRILFGYPKAVIAITVALVLLSLYPLYKISFDYNLMNLQAKGLESVIYARKLMTSKENAGYFVVGTANSSEDAAKLTKKLEALPTVDHVVSMNTFIPEDQDKKLDMLQKLSKTLSDVKPAEYDENLQLMALPEVFENFRNSVKKLNQKLVAEKKPEAPEVGEFLATLDSFFSKLEKEKDKNAVGMLKNFQGGMFAELPSQIDALKTTLAANRISANDIPKELSSRFIGQTGKYMLQIAPKYEIFDRQPLEAFLKDVRSILPNATGEPVMVYESMSIMRDSYKAAFIYAFIAIIVILLLAFRSIRYTLIGLIPLVTGVLFMISGMWLFRISFNSANIIVMPLILGIAVDSGIYIINRYRRENLTPAEVIFSSTGIGVLCNTFTIMASFGALMVARHQGVFSIGAVMSLGMIACQIAFVLVLPAVLNLAGKK
ncbi:MAG: MMPL family transporter [Desulfuromonadales bacterium]|nr:MMPL family transporter [Desulfuromonadales bacterium]